MSQVAKTAALELPPPSKLQGLPVAPGDPLCVIEEFMPGEGVYVDENGVIRAARLGVVEVDMASRRISVRPAQRKPVTPSKGSAVYALLYAVPREDLALFKVFAGERAVPFSGVFTGVLHISQAADHMIKSIYDVVKPGDIVRATVLSSTPPYMLSIKRPQDGVVLAYCSVCGAPLYREPGSSTLVCTRCGNREKRKIAANYILVLRRPRKR